MATYFDVAFYALIGGVFSLIGGILLLVNRRVAMKASRLAAPFAAGALLGAAFFDLLPEAVEIDEASTAFRWVVIAILAFFLLERSLGWFHHHHSHKPEDTSIKKPTAPFIIIGDTLHNAIDGIAIGAAFLVSIPAGIATTIAVASHEIPQEIGDFGILLKSGMRRLHVLMWNIVSALATLALALLTFWIGGQEGFPLAAILGLSAGLFIYIALSDLVPTIHHEAKGKFMQSAAVLLVLGLMVVSVATEAAHQWLDDAGHGHGHEHSQDEDDHHDEEEDHHNEEDHHDE